MHEHTMPERYPLELLIENNRRWSENRRQQDPGFFKRLTEQQAPEYLWIGCADSRVPANEIVGLDPGELFVHRNVANMVGHTDLNCLSVVQYAVDVLKVRHIIVCGHYGCGGVQAALTNQKLGLINNWLRHIQDVAQKYPSLLEVKETLEEKTNRLCELNVIEQVANVAQSTVLESAWERGQPVTVHGWIYSLNHGLVTNLGVDVSSSELIDKSRQHAIAALR